MEWHLQGLGNKGNLSMERRNAQVHVRRGSQEPIQRRKTRKTAKRKSCENQGVTPPLSPPPPPASPPTTPPPRAPPRRPLRRPGPRAPPAPDLLPHCSGFLPDATQQQQPTPVRPVSPIPPSL